MFGSFVQVLAQFFQPRVCADGLDLGVAPVVEVKSPATPEVGHVQDLIGKVTELTVTVAQDVGYHNASLQAISSELTAVAQSDPSAVAAIVCKLLVANQELQGRLERAEETLQDHSHQLQDAMTSARTDSLTGLMNRRALDEELRRCLADFQRHGRPAALFMLDVDRFKKFNDSFGHLAGDQALMHVGEVLREQSRATDIVARFGGEEFVVIFTEATAAAIRERAERLRSAIGQRTSVYDDREMHVTASAGLAEVTAGEAIADWVRRADQALYAAKHAGRDCAFVACGGKFERINAITDDSAEKPPVESAAPRSVTEASAELAAEAFQDTTFVQSIARRIAEWRRGGATLTVVLARLGEPASCAADEMDESARSPIRVALQLARLCLREMDVITRWQADGLAFLLPSTSAVDAKAVARRLRTSLAGDSGDCRSPLSMSIGIAEGIEGNDAKRVLERAWLALDTARCAGRGNIYIHDGLKAQAVKIAAVAR